MKKPNLIYALLLLSAFTSCTKEPVKQQPAPNKPTAVAAVRDSVSYTIDGITYTAGGMGLNNISSGGEDANRKLIFTNNNNIPGYSLVGSNPDSIMYFQKNRVFSNNVNINVFFLKKYTRQQQGPYWMPGLNSALKLFTAGDHPLAEDFEWENSQNGIAIDVSAGNTGYSSYNGYNGVNTVVIPPGFQKNSTFQVISFTPASFGYNLEAKFTAVVFNAAGQPKKLENGYLRLNFGVFYNTYAN